MRVLFVTSELAPIIKTGGLADVSGALTAALHQMGTDIFTFCLLPCLSADLHNFNETLIFIAIKG